MNKFWRVTVIMFFFACFATLSYAVQSMVITTFTVCVSFAPLIDSTTPQITHEPLERVSPITKMALITGTATDDKCISTVKIFYKKYSDSNFSTHTITPSGQTTEYEFSYQIPEDVVTEKIQYRIAASDGQNTGKFPTDGSWCTVPNDAYVSGQMSLSGGTLNLPDGNPLDGETKLTIPAGALTGDTQITITELDTKSVPDGDGACASERPACAFSFEPCGLRFALPCDITLLYSDYDSDGKVEIDGTNTEIEETGLRLFWYDGFHWRLVGGDVEVDSNTVTAQIIHFTKYALFPANITADAYRPKRKILTTGILDRVNDRAYFDGLSGTNATIRIFDLTGREVRKITEFPYEWDGTDNNGRYVESGMYIYQFRAEVDGKPHLISGMMVIAK